MKKQFGARLVITFFLMCLCVGSLRAISSGNLDGTSSVQYPNDGQHNFNAADSSAEGFVWLTGGFLNSATTSLTMTIFPPVMGPINLNSKTLILGADLHLASNVTLTNNGTVEGGGHAIIMHGDLAYASTLTVSASNLIIDGQGHHLDLNGGTLSIADGKTLTLRNITVDNLGATAFTMSGSSSKLVLDNATLNFIADETIDNGVVEVYGKSALCCGANSGGKTITYSSTGNLTIKKHAELLLDHSITFKHDSATTTNIVLDDATSTLRMTGSTLYAANAAGITLTKGALIFDHHSALDGKVTLGGATQGDELEVVFLPGAQTDLNATDGTRAVEVVSTAQV